MNTEKKLTLRLEIRKSKDSKPDWWVENWFPIDAKWESHDSLQMILEKMADVLSFPTDSNCHSEPEKGNVFFDEPILIFKFSVQIDDKHFKDYHFSRLKYGAYEQNKHLAINELGNGARYLYSKLIPDLLKEGVI